MQQLPIGLNRSGCKYTQVWRNGEWAVYRGPYHSPTFDVFRIRKLPAKAIYGREYPEREGYPSAESWGNDALSVTSWKRVLEVLASVGITGPEIHPV